MFRYVALAGGILCAVFAVLPASLYEPLIVRSSGDSAELILPYLPGLAAMIMSLCIAIFAGSLLWGRQVDATVWHFAQRLARPRQGGGISRASEFVCWAGFCFALVLLFDWSSLVWGYFESDDFVFLADNRRLDFPELLYAVMNDHVFPAGRVLIRVMHVCFGTQALAYNSLAVLSLAALIGSGCLYLLHAGVSRLSAVFFALNMIGWTLWGEFTSGEYILMLYESLTTVALLVAVMIVRWGSRFRYRECITVGLLLTYACFASVSGFWLPCAALVFLAGETLRSGQWRRPAAALRRHLPMLVAILVPTLLAIVFYVDAYRRPEGPRFLSSAGVRGDEMELVTQWFYIVTTSLLSLYIAIPHHLSDFGWLAIAMFVSAGVFLMLLAFAWAGLRAEQRIRLTTVSVVLSGVVLMVCLGRPEVGIGYVVPAKYLFMPFTWMCVLLAFVFDGLWNRAVPSSRPRLLKVWLMSVAIAWASHGVSSYLGAVGLPFFETTRGGELREHRREYQAIATLRETLFLPLDRTGADPIVMPDIPGELLCERFPALRFPWGAEPDLSMFIDVLSDHPKRYRLLPATSEFRSSDEFRALLDRSDAARSLYSWRER